MRLWDTFAGLECLWDESKDSGLSRWVVYFLIAFMFLNPFYFFSIRMDSSNIPISVVDRSSRQKKSIRTMELTSLTEHI